MFKYSVHIAGNGSTGYARDHVVCDTLTAAADALRWFVAATHAVNEGSGEPGATADVYPFDERDSVGMSHGDYPWARFITGPRGGVRRETV